jgi:hypothetical protein
MRKYTKRRVYQLVNPIEWAIAGALLLTPEELKGLRDKEQASFKAMQSGTATIDDWRELAEVVNLTLIMAQNGIGPEAIVCCQLAMLELNDTKERFHKTGRMGLSGMGIRAITDVLEYAALQQVSISRNEFERMIKKTKDKIHGLIGNWKGKKDGESIRLTI